MASKTPTAADYLSADKGRYDVAYFKGPEWVFVARNVTRTQANEAAQRLPAYIREESGAGIYRAGKVPNTPPAGYKMATTKKQKLPTGLSPAKRAYLSGKKIEVGPGQTTPAGRKPSKAKVSYQELQDRAERRRAGELRGGVLSGYLENSRREDEWILRQLNAQKKAQRRADYIEYPGDRAINKRAPGVLGVRVKSMKATVQNTKSTYKKRHRSRGIEPKKAKQAGFFFGGGAVAALAKKEAKLETSLAVLEKKVSDMAKKKTTKKKKNPSAKMAAYLKRTKTAEGKARRAERALNQRSRYAEARAKAARMAPPIRLEARIAASQARHPEAYGMVLASNATPAQTERKANQLVNSANKYGAAVRQAGARRSLKIGLVTSAGIGLVDSLPAMGRLEAKSVNKTGVGYKAWLGLGLLAVGGVSSAMASDASTPKAFKRAEMVSDLALHGADTMLGLELYNLTVTRFRRVKQAVQGLSNNTPAPSEPTAVKGLASIAARNVWRIMHDTSTRDSVGKLADIFGLDEAQQAALFGSFDDDDDLAVAGLDGGDESAEYEDLYEIAA